jgi:hypothetical protein
MDADLFEAAKKSAVKHRRSVAKEIEFALFDYLHIDPNADYGTAESYDEWEVAVDGVVQNIGEFPSDID